MKVKLGICIIIAFLISPVIAGVNNDPCLIGWWNFDDGAAKDWSGHGHDGQIKNGAKIIYDAQRGMVLHNPKAGYLEPNEGHSGHIDCGGKRAPADANLTWADITGSFSITCWVKSQTDPMPRDNYFEKDDQAIFTKGSKSKGQLILTTVGTAGRVYFRVRGFNDAATDHINGQVRVDNGQWHHIAATFEYDPISLDAVLRLFIDGVEEYYSPTYANGTPVMSTAPIRIAGSYSQSTKDGEIFMDDVRLYKRALTEAEILEIKNQPTKTDLTGDSKIDMNDFAIFAQDWMQKDYTIPSDTGGLIAHWDFAGPAGSKTVPDLVGGYTATIVGDAALDGSGSVVLSGGVNGPYIDMGADIGQAISKLKEFTVIVDSDWDGNSPGKTWQRLITFAQPGTNQFALMTYVYGNENYLRFYQRYDAHDEVTNSSGLPDMKGHHQIAMVYTPDYNDAGCTIFYIDGVKKTFRTNAGPTMPYVLGATSRNYIGKGPFDYNSLDPNTLTTDVRFDGKINDVKIYGRRLSERDVRDVYQGLTRPLYFKLYATGNWSDSEPANQKRVDYKDLAIFVNEWLQETPLTSH